MGGGKQWPEEKKQEVLEAYALAGNYADVARQTGVPWSTCKRWIMQNPLKVEAIKVRNEQIAEKAIKQNLEERMGEIAGFGKELREKAHELLDMIRHISPSGLAALAKAGVDIELRGLGKPSEILELRGKALDEAIERELERTSRLREETLAPDAGPDTETR